MATVNKATFAAGCFWGVEHYFKKQFKDAIVKSVVGYTGGAVPEPTYREVCGGKTNHAEAVEFDFDPSKTSYHELCEFFFRVHDPTTKDRQGNDVGTQYRSAIFYHNDEQKAMAEQVKQEVAPKVKGTIVSDIVPAGKFWSAEDYHQQYLVKNPGGYCNHWLRW